MTSEDLNDMSEEQVRDIARRIIDALELAEDDGIFGSDSWEGFLEIEV
jgi:CRISPR/Cas system CSM-associated protein Csm4 (group 5 of RAMP superfamily)